MRTTADHDPPFRFDLRGLLAHAQRLAGRHVKGVTIKLPFISVAVQPSDLEKRIAREILIRMADRRVLSARECCSDCAERSLASLRDIRKLLVDKQVELGDATDGPLYLLLELQLAAIRQFFTFRESLEGRREPAPLRARPEHQYLAALEMLRAHLLQCLRQVGEIAGGPVPRLSGQLQYEDAWQLHAYAEPGQPELPDGQS
jgi:hypothetical protein